MNKIKSLLFVIPLSFLLFSDASARDEGGAGRGFGGGRSGLEGGGSDFNRNNAEDRSWNNNYGGHGGYGGSAYYNGSYYNAGYGPVLLPDSIQDPNDDMNQMYQQNLQSMERMAE